MAAIWVSEWDDEEWLKRQSATTLRAIYVAETPAGVDKSTIKEKIKELMTTRLRENAAAGFKNEAENSAYDLLSYAKVVDEEALQAEVTDAEGNKHKVKDIVYGVVNSRIKALDGKDDLVSYLQRKALLETAKTIQKDDADELRVFDEAIKEEKTKIEDELSWPREEISDNEFAHYDEADRSGVLDDVSDAAKNAFIDRLAQLSGWSNVDGKVITENDGCLDQIINNLDVYDNDGKLTDIYSECAELADIIQFDVPDGTDAKEIQGYKQQLLANAAMRATNEILKDKSFKLRYKTAEEMLDAYKQEVASQFERGVLLTCFAGHKETATMLENITYNKKTQKIESKEGKDGIKNALEDILTGKAKINPAAIAVDTEMLNLENKKNSKILKRKRIDENKLTFLQKTKKVFQASWDNIIKQGGYKKILANFAVFGASAALMANPATAAVVTGASMYAGWTAVNAWVAPVYDKLSQEMREKGIKGFKNRWNYRIKNWKRAKAEKYAEPDFKKRAWLRTTEGLVVGGISGGMAGAGTMRMFARQGTMAVGKTTSRIVSLFSRKNATAKFLENPTLENLNALNTARANEKADTVALASVVVGAAVADVVKFGEFDHEMVPQAEKLGTNIQNVNKQIIDSMETIVPSDSAATDSLRLAAPLDSLKQNIPVDSLKQSIPADSLEQSAPVDSLEQSAPVDSAKIQTVEGNSGNAAETAGNETSGGENRADGADNNPVEMEKVSETTFLFPKEYNAEMGITRDQYDLLLKLYAAKDLDRMYMNLSADDVMKNFGGLTKEEVLFKYQRLDAYTDRVDANGRSIEGAVRYHYEEEMTALNNLLNCGNQLTVEQYAAINKALAVIDDQGHYHGEGYVPTSSVMIKAEEGDNCDHGHTNYWKLGHRIEREIPAEQPPAPQQPELDVRAAKLPEVEPEPLPDELPPIQPVPLVIETPEGAKIELNFKDPSSMATGTYATGGDDFAIDSTVDENAEYIRMDNKGNLHLWQNEVTSGDTKTVIGGGIETIHQVPLSLNMNDLGSAEVADAENAITVRYGEGRNALTFTLDKESGVVTTMVGKKEVILDQETAQKASENISRAMTESGLGQHYNLISGSEADQNSPAAERFADEFGEKKAKIEEKLNNKIAKAVEKGGRDETGDYANRQEEAAKRIRTWRENNAKPTGHALDRGGR